MLEEPKITWAEWLRRHSESAIQYHLFPLVQMLRGKGFRIYSPTRAFMAYTTISRAEIPASLEEFLTQEAEESHEPYDVFVIDPENVSWMGLRGAYWMVRQQVLRFNSTWADHQYLFGSTGNPDSRAMWHGNIQERVLEALDYKPSRISLPHRLVDFNSAEVGRSGWRFEHEVEGAMTQVM